MTMPRPKNEWARWGIDTLERALRAYAAAWVALLGADQVYEDFNPDFWELFPAAVPGFVVSAMFSLAGKTRGAPDSASLMPRAQDPPAPTRAGSR